jgi:hypothetical protein
MGKGESEREESDGNKGGDDKCEGAAGRDRVGFRYSYPSDDAASGTGYAWGPYVGDTERDGVWIGMSRRRIWRWEKLEAWREMQRNSRQ